jgi:hypothetical protein
MTHIAHESRGLGREAAAIGNRLKTKQPGGTCNVNHYRKMATRKKSQHQLNLTRDLRGRLPAASLHSPLPSRQSVRNSVPSRREPTKGKATPTRSKGLRTARRNQPTCTRAHAPHALALSLSSRWARPAPRPQLKEHTGCDRGSRVSSRDSALCITLPVLAEGFIM